MKIWAWQLGCWYSINRCQAASPVGSGAGMTKCGQVLNHAWRWLCYVPAKSQRVCRSKAWSATCGSLGLVSSAV